MQKDMENEMHTRVIEGAYRDPKSLTSATMVWFILRVSRDEGQATIIWAHGK